MKERMMMKAESNFKFFVPLELSKAKDKQGNQIMKLGGIASTPDQDSDGEYLHPSGFDLDYFKKYGFINWHHQAKTNPAAIIGEPTKAEVKNDKLYIETELYNDSQLAKDVYTLAKALQSSPSNRSLGFSIEGKVTERDPMDPKIVRKAQITGCAVTPTPKNHTTLAEIIKGHGSDEDYMYEVDSDSANGGTSYILDVTKPTGERIVVDEKLNITIKSINTTNARPLIEEDLDGSIKNLKKVGQKKGRHLTKGEVYGQIFSYLHGINEDRAQQVFTIINKIENLKNK